MSYSATNPPLPQPFQPTPKRHCWKCPRPLATKSSPTRHYRGVHQTEACQPCDCERLFDNQNDCQNHKVEYHNRPNLSYRSPYCDLQYRSKSGLTNHEQSKHKGTKREGKRPVGRKRRLSEGSSDHSQRSHSHRNKRGRRFNGA